MKAITVYVFSAIDNGMMEEYGVKIGGWEDENNPYYSLNGIIGRYNVKPTDWLKLFSLKGKVKGTSIDVEIDT